MKRTNTKGECVKVESSLIRKILGIAAFGALGISLAFGQAATESKPLMAEDVFKNIQVLKGIPVNEFMETMGFFSASLSYNCTDCHVSESLQSWAKFADDIPAKRRARGMILMVNAFNKANFGGRRVLTCYSCHRGGAFQNDSEPRGTIRRTDRRSE